jgi:K+-transporting ATPase KdpF subunit
LPVAPVLARAVAAGVVSFLFVLVGLHWLGAAVAVGLLAVLCAQLPRPEASRT